MEMVIAKFQVSERNENVDGFNIRLTPVASGSKENESFYKWTPGGQIQLSTVNKAAVSLFVPGKELFITFTEQRMDLTPPSVD